MKVIPKRVVVDVDVSAAVQRFNLAMNQVNELLVDRDQLVEAAKLAIITGNNLMLEGTWGVAKSMLASEVFKRIDGEDDEGNPVIIFRKQLMKGTQPDELFGPMKSKKYREEAVWEFNTEGMLPEAHFAFIDEVYRGSEMLLPAMLGILNEHEFDNGLLHMKCPLITAIGTTNFVTDTDELKAFYDRWLLNCKVEPLANSALRIKMLGKYMQYRAQKDKILVKKVSLRDIQLIRSALKFVLTNDECIELYEEIVSAFRQKVAGAYISDRRLCLALTLAQASVLLNRPTDREVGPEHLASTIYGCVQMGSPNEEHFQTVVQEVIENHEVYAAESAQMRDLEETADDAEEAAERRMKPEKIKDMYADLQKIVQGLMNQSPEDRPKSVQNQERLSQVIERFNTVLQKLADKQKTN